MDEIKLVFPTKEYEAAVIGYKEEFLRNDEIMQGVAGLDVARSYEAWLKRLNDSLSEETVQPGLVPSTTYLGVRTSDNKVVGMIDIRHRLNDYLFRLGGNIGYSVRKSERRKGYAKAMLGLALEKCKELGLDRVLVTCYKDNIASAKTIMANGGVLEDEVIESTGITQRYWIALK